MAETSTSSRDKVGDAGASETRNAPDVKEKAHEEAAAVATKAKEAASSAVEKTKDMASSVVQSVEDMASTIGHKAEGAVDSVGGGMKSLAGTIRDKRARGRGFRHRGLGSGQQSGIRRRLSSGAQPAWPGDSCDQLDSSLSPPGDSGRRWRGVPGWTNFAELNHGL